MTQSQAKQLSVYQGRFSVLLSSVFALEATVANQEFVLEAAKKEKDRMTAQCQSLEMDKLDGINR